MNIGEDKAIHYVKEGIKHCIDTKEDFWIYGFGEPIFCGASNEAVLEEIVLIVHFYDNGIYQHTGIFTLEKITGVKFKHSDMVPPEPKEEPPIELYKWDNMATEDQYASD